MIKQELPIIFVKTDILFPNTFMSMLIKSQSAVAAIEHISHTNTQEIICTFQHTENGALNPHFSIKNIYTTGVKMIVSQIITMPENNIKILGNIIEKVYIKSIREENNCFYAEYEKIETTKHSSNPELMEKIYKTLYLFNDYIKKTKQYKDEEINAIKPNLDHPITFTYILSNKLDTSIKNKQFLLESDSVDKNLDKIQEIIKEKNILFDTETKIHANVTNQLTKTQKEYYLKEKIKAIHEELGINDTFNEIEDLKDKAKKLKMSQEAKEKFNIELNKLSKNHHISQEISISKSYIDHLLALPWNKIDKIVPNLDEVKKTLDHDHYGLDKIKDTIIENLSVLHRVKEPKGSILCFVGPPGVGKTSLAESIAKSLKRKFARFALGGVYNESEIRGHRKTYIGAMPGRIIRMLQKCKKDNPIILLDEIDKAGGSKIIHNHQSDITSALLEVLDKSQNKHFIDHYMEVEYDISKITFIATANSLDIQPPLLDRMNIIHLSGYTDEEKNQIAQKYLIPKQIKETGLKNHEIIINENVLQNIIYYYTREAGVRELERLIQKICQKVLVKILKNEIKSETITNENIINYLGEKIYLHTNKYEPNHIGIVNGLAYTSVGGDILHIEAVKIPGDGKITLTGKLGKVMEESATIAYSCFKSKHTDIEYNKFDLHIHVPNGATPKDGPSAGIGLYTSIYSLLLQKPVLNNFAMTGEINLQGKVMPIGGLKEKMLGAIRSEITHIIIPTENKKDLAEIPKNIKEKLTIYTASRIEEVIELAISKKK